MTKSTNISVAGLLNYDQCLSEFKFRKVHNGLWESPDKRVQIYSTGSHLNIEWKAFRDRQLLGSGAGADELRHLLNNL